jgi:hypothetical protein
MASVFPIRGRPTSEGIISKRISHVLWTERKKARMGMRGLSHLRVRRNPAPSKHGRTA